MRNNSRLNRLRFTAFLAALVLLLAGSSASIAGDNGDELDGFGFARLSSVAIPATAQGLLPSVVTTLAQDSVKERAKIDLEDALRTTKNPALANHYQTQNDFVFTELSGLTPAGQLAMTWLKEAHLHGFSDLAKRVAALQETRFPAPGSSAVDWESVDVQDASLLAAWREASQSETPLLVAGQLLTKEDPSVRQATKRYVEAVAGLGATRAQLEIGIAELLSEFLVNLRPSPRQESILRDKVSYLSPDTLWKAEAWRAPSEEDTRSFLAAANEGEAALSEVFNQQLPFGEQYLRLVAAAKKYEAICKGPEWPKVVVRKKPKSWRWRRADNMKALQTRLRLEGFYDGQDTGVFDAATKASLKAYQKLRHLKANGFYTGKTARSLNVPCKRRYETLVLNAKRWRHTALTNEDFYIFVNLAGFKARYVVDGELHTERRVVVGAGRSFWSPSEKRRIYKNRTPILTDSMTSVILNPTWTVPRRIILNEIQPKIDKDPEFLTKNGYVVKTNGAGRESLVQLPGENNALGLVKFYFPNPESIYMHDTPKKGVFNVPRRDYSHGCVRVHEAVEFAGILLREDYRFRDIHFRGGLKSITKRNKTATMKLHRPIPVFLEYYTATVNDALDVTFHPDIYDYDYAALVGPLGRRRPPLF